MYPHICVYDRGEKQVKITKRYSETAVREVLVGLHQEKNEIEILVKGLASKWFESVRTPMLGLPRS